MKFVCLVLKRRRGRRFKQRLIRLCRLPSSHPGTEMTPWSPWRPGGASANQRWPEDDHAQCRSSVQAEYNPNYTSIELSQDLMAAEHDLTEIPDDCLVITR